MMTGEWFRSSAMHGLPPTYNTPEVPYDLAMTGHSFPRLQEVRHSADASPTRSGIHALLVTACPVCHRTAPAPIARAQSG